LLKLIASPAVFEILGSKRIRVASLNFLGRLTSSVTWPFDSHRPFANGGPLKPSLTVSEIFNDECDAVVYMTLNDLQTKVNVIPLVPIDFSYATS